MRRRVTRREFLRRGARAGAAALTLGRGAAAAGPKAVPSYLKGDEQTLREVGARVRRDGWPAPAAPPPRKRRGPRKPKRRTPQP